MDAITLHKKVLVGYQGWFRAAGDMRWDHWNRNWFASPQTNNLAGLIFEMWPDTSDYPDKYPVAGFTGPGGAPAHLPLPGGMAGAAVLAGAVECAQGGDGAVRVRLREPPVRAMG